MSGEIKLALSYDDVLLVPKHSLIGSRSEVDLETNITPNIKIKLPLITVNMDTVTGLEMAIKIGQLGGLGFLPRFDTAEVQAEKISKIKAAKVIAAAAIGCKNGFMDRAEKLVNAGAQILTLDIAHGHMQKSLDATSQMKQRFGDKVAIISGVVATYDGAKDLFKAGADSVRVGLGPGSICTTRIVTGFGVPQVTALLDTARAAREFKKTILADGGTKNSGDIVKGLACGACAVVIGSQFAGTDEAPGEIIEVNGRMFKEYNGSTSQVEKEKQVLKDGTDKGDNYVKHVEGVAAFVPYKGPVEHVVDSMVAGVRSGFSYAGAHNIPELWEKAEFIQITSAGMHESTSHDVALLK
ncbi:MAG TPA: guanosine monophosphate reductase [Candidatus Saccharimonadales bacterium]|nr:guanosine monophosphate reductase [Candidatus Saccharimonadales bacterium]